MLTTRAEQAKPEEARGLLEELFLLHVGKMALEGRVAAQFGFTFRQFLLINTPEAHLAAAMMLVPEGWETVIYLGGENTNVQIKTEAMRQQVNFYPINATAATPALALISAIARSIEP